MSLEQRHSAEVSSPLRSGSPLEQASADGALEMAAEAVRALGGTFTLDGASGLGTAGAWSYGNAELHGKTVRLAASGGGDIQVNRHPFNEAGQLITTAAQVKAAVLKAAPGPNEVASAVARTAGKALEEAYPWGYRSADSAP